jgi:hypothetical protein
LALSDKEEYIAQCMTTGKTREECEQLWNEAHKGDQQTKEEWITQCVAGGKTREECEAAWNEAHQPTGDYATIYRENQMMKVENRQLKKMLREATDIIKAVNSERDAVTDARKYELAIELERDSNGRFRHSDLMKESLEKLAIMKKAVDVARPKDFVSVSAMLEESKRKKEPQLTVGEWDPVNKKYKGGR